MHWSYLAAATYAAAICIHAAASCVSAYLRYRHEWRQDCQFASAPPEVRRDLVALTRARRTNA